MVTDQRCPIREAGPSVSYRPKRGGVRREANGTVEPLGSSGMEQIQVPAALGRSLDVWVEGPPEATPLVVHHGTPSSGLPYPPSVEAATQRGIRWVSYSRPGDGDSARQPG